MRRLLLLYVIFCCFAGKIYGQSSFSITGVVKDTKGGTLPGAGIYLSGYKIATSSGNDGKFSLNNIKPGNYDILVQVIGFTPYTKNVIISDKPVNIEVVLKENVTQLREVVIKADPDRQYYLTLFKRHFIGTTPNAEKCKILNPEVIQAEFNREKRILTVTATDFLIIENKALGYRIKYLLKYFESDFSTNIIFFAGLPHFEELKGPASRKKNWLKKREIAYVGSPQHFFKSLYQNTTKQDGFIINKLIKIPNNQRPPDSLINANIKRFTKPVNGVIRLSDAPNDSLNYWYQVRAKPKYIDVLNRADVLTDTLVKKVFNDVKTINFKDALYVIFTKEKETKEYTSISGHSISRPLDMPNYQISVVHQKTGQIHFYENGGIFDPMSLLYEGFWAYEKVADMVPMDYNPQSKK